MELPRAGRRGSFLLVAVLLVISILSEQFGLIHLLPWLNDLGRVQPMIVFLDIPLRLPVIDWVPVGILFVFFYLVVVAPELSRHRPSESVELYSVSSRGRLLRQKGWAVFTGWWLLLILITAAGGLYTLIEDDLPKEVRNGIDSFGFRADLAIPFHEDIIHLHGGMIMFVALLIGGHLFLQRAQLPISVAIPQPQAAGAEAEAESESVPIVDPVGSKHPQAPRPKSSRSKISVTPPAEPKAKPQPQPQCRLISVPEPVQLPSEPTPVMVRPCVVKGVLEPS